MSVTDEVSIKKLLDIGVELAARQTELYSHSRGRLRPKLDTLEIRSRFASVKVEHSHNFGFTCPPVYRITVRENRDWSGHLVRGWRRTGAFRTEIEELLTIFERDKDFEISLKMFGQYMVEPRYMIDIVLLQRYDYVISLNIDLRPTYMNNAKLLWLVASFTGTLADRLRDQFGFDATPTDVSMVTLALMKRLEAEEAKGPFELEMAHRDDLTRTVDLHFEHNVVGWVYLTGARVDGTNFDIATVNALNILLSPRFDVNKCLWQ